jgi:cysteinyl-tRNA synthetase
MAKGSKKNSKRQMEWESPWGIGFPGWHIECSAMSIKYLGRQFDIHCGGADHIGVHHTNEIAQSEAATGKSPWVKYWLHGEFLNIAGGKKMAKSAANFLTLENAVLKKGINPLAFRFAALQTHYRKPMEYSDEAMKSAKRGLEHLHNQTRELQEHKFPISNFQFPIKGKNSKRFKNKFLKALNDDLNMPQALAVMQEVLKSKLPKEEKLALVLDFDKVLGLDLNKKNKARTIPGEVRSLYKLREKFRKEKKWAEADEIRKKIEKLGYKVEDTKEGARIVKNNF